MMYGVEEYLNKSLHLGETEYRGVRPGGEDKARQGKTKQETIDRHRLEFMACVGEEFANHDDDGRTDQLEAPRTIPSVS